MAKRSLILLAILILVTACGSPRSTGRETYDVAYETASEVVERAPDMQNVQFSPSQVLPPYGMRAAAEVAVLELKIRSTEKKAENQTTDIQNAVTDITAQVSANDAIVLNDTATHQVSGSYVREENSKAKIPSVDTTAVTIKLISDLSQYDGDFGKSIVAFNQFLNTLDLPDTINIQVLSVSTELEDLEAVRNQIIAQVYQELDAIKQEYGSAVIFEVMGLHTPLQKIKLSDIEYYLYLEPVITVTEF